MTEPTPTISELEEEKNRQLVFWNDAVGKVFKLTDKSYGVRSVTYTLIKAVRDLQTPGDFQVEVSCAELTARVLSSKRAHSSVCKEGMIEQNQESILTPNSFGEECPLDEFEKVSGAILTHATMNLDLLMQQDAGEEAEIEVPIDLPHLKLTDMEASLVRNSPFLIKDAYLLTPNSYKAAFDSVNQELLRAARNSRLTDACDPIYVEQKNEAVNSLLSKLNGATLQTTVHENHAAPAEVHQVAPVIQKRAESAAPNYVRNTESYATPAPKAASANRGPSTPALVKKQSRLSLALLGDASAAFLSWEQQNPSKEGAVFRMGNDCGLLEFVQWAHVSGRTLSEEETTGKSARSFFGGIESCYTGPDREGVYPRFRFESEN